MFKAILAGWELWRYLGNDTSRGSPALLGGRQPGAVSDQGRWRVTVAGTPRSGHGVPPQPGRAARLLIGGAGWEMFSCAKGEFRDKMKTNSADLPF